MLHYLVLREQPIYGMSMQNRDNNLWGKTTYLGLAKLPISNAIIVRDECLEN